MKKALIALFVCVCFTATFARAEDPPDSSLAEGFGAPIPIESGYDYSGIDRSYMNDPDTVVFPGVLPTFPIKSPVWHPDGKRIFYTDQFANICWITETGGKPHVAFENISLYPYNGKKYVLSKTIDMIVGFSPDGNNLYFIRSVYSSGEIVIKLDDKGNWNGVGGNATYLPSLERLDMNTGEVNTIAKNAFTASLSRSGKYIAYRENGTLTTVVMNLESNERWEVSIPDLWGYFTTDDQYILSPWVNESGLSRMPIQGGKKEKYTAFPSGNIWYSYAPDLDPGGDWLLYTIWNGESFSNSVIRSDGGKYTYTKSVVQLSIFNLETGKTYTVLPSSKIIDATQARFSPDGKRFCYIHKNFEGKNNREETKLYIKDITLPSANDPDIKTAATGTVPAPLTLTGNYPNPFNPSTTISFTLPSSGMTALSIYGVTGQKVRDLVNEPMGAGEHAVEWDGRDASGQPVSSGVYLIRLSQGSHTTAGRMLLAK